LFNFQRSDFEGLFRQRSPLPRFLQPDDERHGHQEPHPKPPRAQSLRLLQRPTDRETEGLRTDQKPSSHFKLLRHVGLGGYRLLQAGQFVPTHR